MSVKTIQISFKDFLGAPPGELGPYIERLMMDRGLEFNGSGRPIGKLIKYEDYENNVLVITQEITQ